MKDWFNALEPREQLFVGVGGVVVVLTIVYSLVWLPFSNKHTALRAEIADWQQAVLTLKPLQPVSAGPTPNSSVRGAVQNASTQSPIIIVDQTLRSRGLDRYRQRSQPSGGNGIRVEFENVAFDDLVLWLGDLSSGYGMHVQAGSFSQPSQQSAGRVNASLTIERAR